MKNFNQELWQNILAINLDRIWQRLVVKNKFTAQRAHAAIVDYRKFLYLSEVTKGISPTPDVDEAWHAHIMHLPSYIRDCMNTFGRIIYHVPNQISQQEVNDAMSHHTEQTKLSDSECSSCWIPPAGECAPDYDEKNPASVPKKFLTFKISIPVDEYQDNPKTAFPLSKFEKLSLHDSFNQPVN